MKHYIYCTPEGKCVSSTTVPDGIEPPAMPGLQAVETREHLNPTMHYVYQGQVMARPPQPSYPAVFEPSSGRWIPDVSASWVAVRARRDQLIAASDWAVLPDVSMSPERRQAWLDYRQSLRDITSQPDPTQIDWPVAPA